MRHKCLASFIVFILYFSISGLIMFAEVKDLAKAKTLIKVLAQSGIYEKLPQYAETLVNSQNDPQTKTLTLGIAQSIDPKFIQSEIEKNAEPFLAYLNGKQNLPNISFDLRSFKVKLQSKLPRDSSSQIFITQIPDTYGLAQIKNPDQIFGRAKLTFKVINYGYLVSLIVSILMIIFLVLLGLSWWPAILRWVGWGIFLPAFSMLVFTFISLAIPKILLGKYGTNLDPEIIKMINPVIEALNNATKTISLLYSGIISGLGFVLLFLSYILPHPPEPKPVANPPSPTR